MIADVLTVVLLWAHTSKSHDLVNTVLCARSHGRCRIMVSITHVINPTLRLSICLQKSLRYSTCFHSACGIGRTVYPFSSPLCLPGAGRWRLQRSSTTAMAACTHVPRSLLPSLPTYPWRYSYNPVPYEDFMDELIDKIYGPTNMPSLGNIHPHRLALFFGIMAIGHQRSVEFATAGGLNLNAERYYVLACAALSLAPIIAEAMCATVQALFLVLCYLGCGTRRACEESWLLIGVMARVGFRVRSRLIAISVYRDLTRSVMFVVS